MRRLILLIGMMLVLSHIAIASASYQQVGGTSENFDLTDTRGFFNTQIDDNRVSVASAVMTAPKYIPLVADLNNDSVKDIIIHDGSLIKIFNNRTLTGVATAAANNDAFPMLIYDIDGDGLDEIIQINDNNNLEIFSMNSSGLYKTTDAIGDGAVGQYIDERGILACESANNCLIVGVSQQGTSRSLIAQAFNSTNLSHSQYRTVIDFTTLDGGEECFSAVPKMTAVDYDNDGNTEFIFSMMHVGANSITLTATDEDVITYIVDLNGTRSAPVLENHIKNTQRSTTDPGVLCSTYTEPQRAFTSPTLHDIDGFASTYEILIGVAVDDDEYKIYSYDSTGGVIDDYPEIVQADGVMLSNVFVGNFFSDTGSDDFCVLGSELQDLDLLCASEEASEFLGLGNSEEYTFTYPFAYNITQDDPMSDIWYGAAHAVQHSQQTDNGADLDEIAIAYGIYSIDEDNEILVTEYAPTVTESVVLSVDAESIGWDDLIMLTNNNLFYYDDGFVNSGAYVDSYTINPCIDSTWKQNTTVNVQLTCTDADSDQVSGNVSLYYGSSQERSLSSGNVSSGTVLSFSFNANETTPASSLRMECRDDENPLDPDVQLVTFSVAGQGVEFGDCSTSYTNTTDTDESLIPGTSVPRNNSISSGLDQVETAFNIPALFIILLIMLIIPLSIIFQAHKSGWDSGTTMLLIAIPEIVVVIFATYLGVFSAGLIITLAILGLIIIGLWIGRKIGMGSAT